MIKTIQSSEEYERLKNLDGVLFYFSHDECNVCKVLKPKIYNLLKDSFPQITMYYVNIKVNPAIAGQESIFNVPTVSVLFEGKEFFRKSRNIGIDELHDMISRPYTLLFEN